VEAEVPKPDLDEGIEGLPQRREQRGYRRLGDATRPPREVADLHSAGIRDVDAADPGGQRRLVEPGTAALRARGEGDGALDELADVRLERLLVLLQEGFLLLRDQPLICE